MKRPESEGARLLGSGFERGGGRRVTWRCYRLSAAEVQFSIDGKFLDPRDEPDDARAVRLCEGLAKRRLEQEG